NSTIMFMMIFVASFLLGSMIFGETHAYLSDTETSTGNTIIAAWYRSGKIVGFNVSAEVISGDVVNFTVYFENTGNVDLSAKAIIEIRGKEGEIVASSIVSVSIGEIKEITASWDTTDANHGNYNATARVFYDYEDEEFEAPLETLPTDPVRFKVIKSG
ncbi:MAG: hypothetical protein QMD78_05335, partial [Methanocellales archaeon]|nr:hypothetical protein [Methanocellales archaeon]